MDYNFWQPQTVGISGQDVPANVMSTAREMYDSDGFEAARNYLANALNIDNRSAASLVSFNIGTRAGGTRRTGGGGGPRGPRITDPLHRTGPKYTRAKLDALGYEQEECPTGAYKIGERIRYTEGEQIGTSKTGRRVTAPGSRTAYTAPYCAFPDAKGPQRLRIVDPQTTGGFFEAFNSMPGILYKGGAVGANNTKGGWLSNPLVVAGLGAAGLYVVLALMKGKWNLFK